MPRLLTKKLLSEARVATRPMPERTVAAILSTVLLASDEGILVTDLEHRSLAVNQRFGELFRVTPEEAVVMEPEELRKRVYPRLQDPSAWRRQLDEIYGEPDRVHEDEMELLGDPPIWLMRWTGPILDDNHQAVGRLWRFRDISGLKRRERMQNVLTEISTCRDADPAKVCKLVVDRLSAFYKASAILSIRDGDKMIFREMAGMPIPFSLAKSNKVRNAYCQIALETVKPLLIQNGRQHATLCKIPPAILGFTRYLGVPICDRGGDPIGTLCIMDGRSEIPLDADDEQFLSMMGLRVATELDREKLYMERTSEQRAVLEQQKLDLSETHKVVTSMNRAFEMAGETMATEALIEAQVALLRGLLGYDSAALLLPSDDGLLLGSLLSGKATKASICSLKLSEEPAIRSLLNSEHGIRPLQVQFEANSSGAIAELLGTRFLAIASLPVGGQTNGLLALGSRITPAYHEERHQVLLEALVDQVSLLLTAHTLQRDLVETHDELKATQQRLVQSEKLSVVGTLAASIAHDIRNIVSSLALECSLGDVDPTTALANVRQQLDRFAVLAHRLLSYARPKLIAREPVELNELIRRVVALTDAQTRVSGVKLQCDRCSDAVHILADSSQTEHLFVNLVLNAVQAMRSGGGQIRISTCADDHLATVRVEDNGPGIPAEELTRIFEPFHSTKPEGFGLGLYSCKRIAEEHGWKLAVESEIGRGTSFVVTIPLCLEGA
jgi:signal transduction histidine kinase